MRFLWRESQTRAFRTFPVITEKQRKSMELRKKVYQELSYSSFEDKILQLSLFSVNTALNPFSETCHDSSEHFQLHGLRTRLTWILATFSYGVISRIESITEQFRSPEECDPAWDRYDSVRNARKSHDKSQRTGSKLNWRRRPTTGELYLLNFYLRLLNGSSTDFHWFSLFFRENKKRSKSSSLRHFSGLWSGLWPQKCHKKGVSSFIPLVRFHVIVLRK